MQCYHQNRIIENLVVICASVIVCYLVCDFVTCLHVICINTDTLKRSTYYIFHLI